MDQIGVSHQTFDNNRSTINITFKAETTLAETRVSLKDIGLYLQIVNCSKFLLTSA